MLSTIVVKGRNSETAGQREDDKCFTAVIDSR